MRPTASDVSNTTTIVTETQPVATRADELVRIEILDPQAEAARMVGYPPGLGSVISREE